MQFAKFGHKEPSFKFGKWGRYTTLITACTSVACGGVGIWLVEPRGLIALSIYSILAAGFLGLLEWPIVAVIKILAVFEDYRWRALLYFLMSLPMWGHFPTQLCGLFLTTDALIYFIAHLRKEKGKYHADNAGATDKARL
eukprot:TRINITY_DN5747_c0_g1_i2.p1 TRINITY_DN5747_c0_g1~~TRINITY_DN5747_c0_g1_i2.p1  ORF type:complete len:140 (-),score=9.71 TRINITY_DN5747_c0_g1_i2:122-541(-)